MYDCRPYAGVARDRAAGPVVRPGCHLALLTATTVAASVLANVDLHLEGAEHLNPARLPSVLTPFALSFTVGP